MVHSNRHTVGWLDYIDGGAVMCASTREEGIAKHLYSTSDKCASHNIGRVLAQRMIESGIVKAKWHIGDKKYHGKV